MNPKLPIALLAALAATGPIAAQQAVTVPVVTLPATEPAATSRPIDLAICLDTSGSMEGLIDAARTQIWAIVNDLALAEPSPDLRVALLTFGNTNHNAEDGWVHVDTDFTSDLDVVSERLFALTTNGGDEYVGRVISRATKSLAWHGSSDALRLLVVAGNESADQDQVVSFRDACRNAITNDIMVNSVYCGNPADGIAPGWREVATLADGKFASIDHNDGMIIIATPFDDQLAELSAAVSSTYIPYTESGWSNASNQMSQDANNAALNTEASASRALAKCSATYASACGWDLIGASEAEDFDWSAIEDDKLPEEMREMTLEERKAHVAKKAEERAGIEAQIVEISAKRQDFVNAEMARQQLDASRSLGAVLRNAIREQARSRGFDFATPDEPVAPEQPLGVFGPEQQTVEIEIGDGC